MLRGGAGPVLGRAREGVGVGWGEWLGGSWGGGAGGRPLVHLRAVPCTLTPMTYDGGRGGGLTRSKGRIVNWRIAG